MPFAHPNRWLPNLATYFPSRGEVKLKNGNSGGGNSGDLYEQAVVKPALSLSKGRPRDLFAPIPHIYSA